MSAKFGIFVTASVVLIYIMLLDQTFGQENPIIAMRGHGGFGNQVYQYLGLAASMRVAHEANKINSSWSC